MASLNCMYMMEKNKRSFFYVSYSTSLDKIKNNFFSCEISDYMEFSVEYSVKNGYLNLYAVSVLAPLAPLFIK